MAAIDRRRRKTLGPAWEDFARRTSRLPFAAILAGRNRLALSELSWTAALAAAALFAVYYFFHETVIGLPPYLP